MGIAKEHHPIREPVRLVLVSVLAPWIPPARRRGSRGTYGDSLT